MSSLTRADQPSETEAPRWLIVADADRNVRRMRKLPVSQNLRQAMREERARLEAEGWSTAGDGRYGVLQARRGPDRAQVALCTVDPQDAGYIVGLAEG